MTEYVLTAFILMVACLPAMRALWHLLKGGSAIQRGDDHKSPQELFRGNTIIVRRIKKDRNLYD